MRNLQVLQNRAAKVILDKPKFSSASDALNLLNWQPLTMRRRLQRIITMHKYLNNGINHDANFKRNSTFHNYDTGGKNNIYLPKVRTNWGKQSFMYQASVEWNLLPENTRDSQTLSIFKSTL